MSNIALVFLSALFINWAFPPSTAEGRLRKFYIIMEKVIRSSAEEQCTANNYTGLVTVYDHQDNMKLSTLIKQNLGNEVSSGWIGTRRGIRSKKWSNGDVTFNRNSTGDNGNIICTAMKASGDWESLKCSNQTHFMCYKQGVGVERSYRLIHENRSWFEAQRYCRENHTDLVSIRDEEENERVMKEGENCTNSFWIGLLEDEVEWADGGQSAYRNWKLSPQPDTKSHYPEAYMDSNGNWSGSHGGNAYPLCYKSFIHVSEQNMSWEDALDDCDTNANTSGLLIIQSENDQIETERELIRRRISGPVWVGLRQSRLFGFWIWINGLNLRNYSNWKGGSQPEHLISEHCGAIEKVDGQYKWRDKDCRSSFTFLCEGK